MAFQDPEISQPRICFDITPPIRALRRRNNFSILDLSGEKSRERQDRSNEEIRVLCMGCC